MTKLYVPTLASLIVLSACASKVAHRDEHPLGSLVRADASTQALCPDAAQGAPCLMTQAQADELCTSRGMHLPTSRELVAFSVSMGAKGRLEASEVKRGKVPEGYYLVDSLNPGRKRDPLYFNHTGYDAKRGGLQGELLWTASLVPGKPAYAHVFYGDWGGGGGKPQEHRRTYRNSVRCLPGLAQ